MKLIKQEALTKRGSVKEALTVTHLYKLISLRINKNYDFQRNSRGNNIYNNT